MYHQNSEGSSGHFRCNGVNLTADQEAIHLATASDRVAFWSSRTPSANSRETTGTTNQSTS